MKFSRLRLVGFKSFVEPSEFVIERGLTGVVGPNGCGKSNLVEALRWVMGESSYKNMRASGMDDVIFSGSSTRPARNTAEVTLFLDNSDRAAPASFNDADELQVARRIEREAGSVYRINGREARARDVQLLFADQSTGARSPSMVGQGRIGELIQAKPQARRALLEEAAGISGLHTRRHEAELRLRAAEQNLERLDDVVGELESQIESLRRQARQAVRFKKLSFDIRQAEATLFHLHWTQAKAHEGEAQTALNEATARVAAQAQAQMEAARDQAVAARQLPELRDAEAEAAAALQRLTIARAQIEEEADRIRARRDELQKRLAQLDADIERERTLIHDNRDILDRLALEEATLKTEQHAASEAEEGAKARLDAASGKLTTSEAFHAAITAERAEASAARVQAENAERENGGRRQRLDVQLADIDREITANSGRLGALPDPAAKRRIVEQCEGEVDAGEEAALSSERRVEAARQDEAACRAPLQEARAELGRIETEARTLAKILNAATSDLFPAVLEEIKVERGMETALGAALGEDLDAPLDSGAPVHWANIDSDAADPALPAGALPLSRFVEAPRQLSRRLSQIGVIEAADAPAMRARLRPGQRLVTREGALWRWDGYTCGADAPTAAAQRLAQKNRLAELDGDVVAATQAARLAQERLAAAETALGEAIATERASRESARAGRQKLDAARAALGEAEKAASALSSRQAALSESRIRLAESLDEAAAALAASQERLAQCPDLGDVQARLELAAGAMNADRSLLAEARAAHDAFAREREMRGRRLEAIVTERASWLRRAQSADSQIAALSERRAEAHGENERLADAPDEVELRRRKLMTQLSEIEALRKAAADRLQEAENRQAALDKAATRAIQVLAEAREFRARAEERLTAADERRREIEARIRTALNVPPHLVIGHAGLDADAPMPDAGDIERQLERLKVERERLGAVNLRAEEEQQELSQRLETIVSEREDILEAIRKLRQAIQSLNREGRERLLSAFEQVNVHFQRLFNHLFGGGTAELQLVDSEDPLEAGLEFLVRPPGKKPQTMTLLSGGEQALVAMALIFAVFLTNPAPICVLDEVDAPLDDHNVERFANLMDEMARTTETRFVIITHNPITMARMNRLFGVTMPEQGVSQLVSVDLQTAESFREAG